MREREEEMRINRLKEEKGEAVDRGNRSEQKHDRLIYVGSNRYLGARQSNLHAHWAGRSLGLAFFSALGIFGGLLGFSSWYRVSQIQLS